MKLAKSRIMNRPYYFPEEYPSILCAEILAPKRYIFGIGFDDYRLRPLICATVMALGTFGGTLTFWIYSRFIFWLILELGISVFRKMKQKRRRFLAQTTTKNIDLKETNIQENKKQLYNYSSVKRSKLSRMVWKNSIKIFDLLQSASRKQHSSFRMV